MSRQTPVVDPTFLTIRGVPSLRVLSEFPWPALRDSVTIVRATLELTPVQPVAGLPNDPGTLNVRGLATDFGAKSPVEPLSLGVLLLVANVTDTVRVEVATVLQFWQIGLLRGHLPFRIARSGDVHPGRVPIHPFRLTARGDSVELSPSLPVLEAVKCATSSSRFWSACRLLPSRRSSACAGSGCPGREQSARAMGTGAFSFFDASSSVSPASLAYLGSLTASFTVLNDYRSSTDPAGTGSIRDFRFPQFAVGGPIPHKPLWVGLSYSNLTRDYSLVFPTRCGAAFRSA